MRRTGIGMVLFTGLAVTLAGCDSTGPTRTGTAQISLASQSELSAYLGSVSVLTEEGFAGNVSLSSVAEISVELSRVEATRTAGEGESGWFALELEVPGSINLLALPTEEATGLLLAKGELTPGVYSNVRLFFTNATITFSQDVTVGSGPAATTYEAGVAHELRIPSGMQTGIKVPSAGFTIEENEESAVVLVFDPATSVQTINATSSFLIMSPVLTAKLD